MRLVNPGPGEIADRLTILSLKLLFGAAAGKPVEHFERERNALLVSFRQTDAAKLVEPLLELSAVNAALWHAEDDLRAARLAFTAADGGDAADWRAALLGAFQIQALNDRRAELVSLINVRAGEPVQQEKLTNG